MKKQYRTHRCRRGILCACICAAVLSMLFLQLTASASGEPGLPGDVTGDGKVDAKDYFLLKRFVLGTCNLGPAQRLCADLNGDYTIDEADYELLKSWILGNIQLPQTGNGAGNQQGASNGNTGSGNQWNEARAEAEEVLRLVNQARAQNGLQALTLSDRLCELATLKAEDMVINQYFDHTSPTYGTPFEMLQSFGVSYSSAGENIAAGQNTPEEVMNAWMDSTGHRANILRADYTELGVGIATGPRGVYWVQLFRRP